MSHPGLVTGLARSYTNARTPSRDGRLALVAVGSTAIVALVLGLHAVARARPQANAVVAAAGGSQRTWWVSPHGRGTACTKAKPCGSVDDGVARASSGDVVMMMRGQYGPQVIADRHPNLASFASNVVVTAQSGTDVTVAGIDVYPPHITLRALTVRPGPVFVRPGSTGSRLEDLTVNGALGRYKSVNLFASHSALVDSTLTGNVDSDELQIGDGGRSVVDVSVSHNRIGPAVVGPNRGHVDCIQMASQADHVTIERNVLLGCANSALIVKPDLGPITNLIVQDNFLQGCLQRTATCDGYYALYVRSAGFPISGIVVRHNTIDGAVSVDSSSVTGVTMVANIIGTLDQCGPWEDDNLIAASRCAALSPHDVRGSPMFVDRASADLHLAAGSRGIAMGTPVQPPYDLDGLPWGQQPDVGAAAFRPTSAATPVAIAPPGAPVQPIADQRLFNREAAAAGRAAPSRHTVGGQTRTIGALTVGIALAAGVVLTAARRSRRQA